jgi:hypothetical protein
MRSNRPIYTSLAELVNEIINLLLSFYETRARGNILLGFPGLSLFNRPAGRDCALVLYFCTGLDRARSGLSCWGVLFSFAFSFLLARVRSCLSSALIHEGGVKG